MRIIDLYQGDCIELMKQVPDHSIDMVLCDLPYGTTRNKWDTIIPFEPLWEQYKRIIKSGGCIALFSQMPFSAQLVMSNLDWYRYEWILKKNNPTGFLNANRMPLKAHESVQIFYDRLPTYNPQYTEGKPYVARHTAQSTNYGTHTGCKTDNPGRRCPNGFIEWKMNAGGTDRFLHPTQKPVSICEYLIKTYTDEGQTVLDNCMGSGSTGVACVNTGRSFIGMELDEGYFQIAKNRIAKAGEGE